MAAPVTHVVLALKILSLLPRTTDKKAFIVGTSFPDIRYMTHIPREITHIEPVSWQDVVDEPSPFRAGMLFHNLVDTLRIKHFEPYFYDRHNPSLYTPLFIKLYPLIMKTTEDAVLYDIVPSWDEVIGYFDTIYPEETTICSDAGQIQKWHQLLQKYFEQTPSVKTIEEFLHQNSAFTNLWNDPQHFDPQKTFNMLFNDQDFSKKVREFYHVFETYLSKRPEKTPDSN